MKFARKLLPILLFVCLTGNAQTETTATANFALLLPLSGPLASQGQAIRDGFMGAYFNAEQNTPDNETIHVYDTQGNAVDSLYTQALNEGASAVIGPLIKPDVQQLNQLTINKPTLALNFTPNGSNNNALFQFALSPQDETTQVVEKARHDGATRALIIAPNSDWGEEIVQTFTTAWEQQGGKISETLTYDQKTHFDQAIKSALHIDDETTGKTSGEAMQRRQDIDMIFLVASPAIARQITPLLKFYYAGDVPIYATSSVYSGIPNPNTDKDLNGIRFCDIPLFLDNSVRIQQARSRMQKLIPINQRNEMRLYAFGIDAYQIINHYDQLVTGDFSLAGMTGTLHLGSHQQILRSLQWAQFVDGKPQLI